MKTRKLRKMESWLTSAIIFLVVVLIIFGVPLVLGRPLW